MPAAPLHRAWYRARGKACREIGPVIVPTLHIRDGADDAVGRMAIEGTADFVNAPYRFELLPGVGHDAAGQMPERMAAMMAGKLRQHSA